MEKSRNNLFSPQLLNWLSYWPKVNACELRFWWSFQGYPTLILFGIVMFKYSISKSYYLSLKKSHATCTWSEKSNAMIGMKSNAMIEKWIENMANILGNQSVRNILQIFWQIKVFENILKIFWQIAVHCKNDFCNQFTAVDGDIVITGASNYPKCQLQYRALIVTILKGCWWYG